MQTSVKWYLNSIKELQLKLNNITKDQHRHDLHNEGGWDKHLVRLDVCKDIIDKLVEDSKSWS